MSIEHKRTYRWANKYARLTLATLSFLASQLDRPPSVDLKDTLSPRPAVASELKQDVYPTGRIVYSSAKGRNSEGDLIDPAFYTADLKNLKQQERIAISRFARDKAFWDNSGNIVFGRSYEVFIYDSKNKQERRLIGLDDNPGYWNQADCPSFDPKNGRVNVSVNNDKTDLDLYSYNLDGSRVQITKSQYYTAENCGLISPNGKWLDFSIYSYW